MSLYIFFAQDDEAKVKRLIEDLGSDFLDVREKAKKFVQQTHEKTSDPEVKIRTHD